jgi:acylphosphatase
VTVPESRLHAFVSGVVQGVGFRYFVVDAAAAAGLVGWVRNLRDGRVEFVAEGSRSSLERLLADVRRGPRGGRVDAVEEAWQQPTGEFRGFRLEHTG